MALQSFTVSIGALTDANNNDKNYVSGEAIYVKTIGGSFAPIFRDLSGTSEIAQDGLANQTNEKGQFTFFVEAGDYILEYQNQSTPVTVVGVDYFNNRVEETVNQIIIDTATSRGFRVVGDFASGFTYELPNDVAIDGSGNYWVYADINALPVTVTAGTTPSAPTYTQTTFSQASAVTTTAGINAQQFIDNFELKIFQSPTDNLTKVTTFAGGVGVVYEVRKSSDNSLATIYSDKDGVTEIVQNGIVNVSDGDAEAVFYIADGDYKVTINAVSAFFGTGHNSLSGRNSVGAHDSIYTRTATYETAKTEDSTIGTRYRLTDYMADFFVVDPSDTGGFYLPSDNGNRFRLIENDGYISLRAFDITSSGLTQSLDSAQSVLPKGKNVVVPTGTWEGVNNYIDNIQLIGDSKASIIKAATGAEAALKIGRHAPDWDYYSVENVTIDGRGRGSYGVLFEDSIPANADFAGRWSMERFFVANCSIGVFHKHGNIGNRFRDFNVRLCDYGFWHQKGTTGVMHSGASYYEGGEISLCDKAAIYVNDSQDGLGAYHFSNVVIEGNAGFGIFMDLNNITPYSGGVFDNVWLEANATSPSVTIGGTSYTPRNALFKNAKPVELRNMSLANIELQNSTLIATNCRLDDASQTGMVIDGGSVALCDNLYANGAIGGDALVRSLSRQAKPTSTTVNLSARGELRQLKVNTIGNTLLSQDFGGGGTFQFVGTSSVSASSVSDGVISDSCAELVIPANHTLTSSLASSSLTAGKWVVWGIHAKITGGVKPNFADIVNPGVQKLGNVYLKNNDWTCTFGVAKVGLSTTGVKLRFITDADSATIRFADWFVVEFESEYDALIFANSRVTPK